jgi:diguanylate cyclase (GGDEF)-like protein
MAILQETGAAGARTVAEDLVRKVGELRFKAPNAETVQVTVSVGFAAFPEHVLGLTPLVKMADDGLYAAKNQGRNRVGFTGPAADMLQ